MVSAAALSLIVGTWTGTSLCTPGHPACTSEHVVYVFRRQATPTPLRLAADKIVNGRREHMGEMNCTYHERESTVTCDVMGRATIALRKDGKRLYGAMLLPDGTFFRRIDVRRT